MCLQELQNSSRLNLTRRIRVGGATSAWAQATERNGSLETAIEQAERDADNNEAARYSLIFLYQLAGRGEEAQALADRFSRSQ